MIGGTGAKTMRELIRIDDFTPSESEIFRKIAEHAVVGRQLEAAGASPAKCAHWVDQVTKLVAQLTPDPGRYQKHIADHWLGYQHDERTAPGIWERESRYARSSGNEPKTDGERIELFRQALAAAERIVKSPAVPVTRRATSAMTSTDANRLHSKLVSKVGSKDVEFLILGKKLRNVLLLMRALAQDASADSESAQGLHIAAVAQGKELALELFDLARSCSLVHLLLFEYEYPSLGDKHDQTLVKLAQVELAILEMAGLDAPARKDFIRFMHHECASELEQLAAAGLSNTRETLYSLGARGERSIQLRPLIYWIELVTGSSVMAWNLALVSSLSLSTAEWSGLVGKFLAAIALWGKSVRDLTTGEKQP
jgi:hypothetical protein